MKLRSSRFLALVSFFSLPAAFFIQHRLISIGFLSTCNAVIDSYRAKEDLGFVNFKLPFVSYSEIQESYIILA